jgi:Tfp pilus assembly protein PilF
MKKYLIKPTWVILPIVLFSLFSCASTQQKQSESRDADFYFNQGIAYFITAQYDRAISDFTKAIEIDPKLAVAYSNRGVVYYFKKEYDKSWEDVKEAQNLGYHIPTKFLEDLREASGRQN